MTSVGKHLPNGAAALVQDAKVKDYLLNPDNPQNRGKSGLFTQFGFDRSRWQVLKQALERHALQNPVQAEMTSPHGTKFVVQCAFPSPDGRNPCLRSVWIVDAGSDRPRLVTAY